MVRFALLTCTAIHYPEIFGRIWCRHERRINSNEIKIMFGRGVALHVKLRIEVGEF